MTGPIYLTHGKTFTYQECFDLIDTVISRENLDKLTAHVCLEDIAKDIISFWEYEGHFLLNFGTGDFIEVTINKK
jgi:hypothetical protein